MNIKAGSLAHRTATQLERQLDNATGLYRRLLGYRQPVRVVPYVGFGTPNHVQVRGRVLSDGKVMDREGMNVARNIIHMLRRYKTDEVPDARLKVRFAGEEREVRTDAEGFFHVVFDLESPHKPSHLMESYEVELIEPLQKGGQEKTTFRGYVQMPDDARFVVVSDVDDTIVHTGASDFLKHARTVLLNNARTRAPFAGVAPFYKALQNEQDRPTNPIFYVSSSPWNLYDLFVDFMQASKIPVGTMFLKDFGMSEDHWIKTGHSNYKIDRIRELLRAYPQQGFILIGDSGQHDPEIYAKLVKEHPGRIQAVYLRDVASSRREEVEAIARDIRAHDTGCVVVEDSLAAAEHAQTHGWLTPDDLEEVRRHVQRPVEDERERRVVGMPVEFA